MCRSGWFPPLAHAILVTWFVAMIPTPAPAQTTDQATAQPVRQLPSNWNDAVESLAAKIASLAGRTRTISLEVKNISSVSSSDAAAIRQSLEAALSRRQFHVVPQGDSGAQLVVTLSENSGAYIWVAQLHAASTGHVAMISVPRTAATAENESTGSLVLGKRLVWQQRTKFVDFAILTAPDGSTRTLLILEPDRLAYYSSIDSTTWRRIASVPIPHSDPWPRDLRGSIDPETSEIRLANVRCAGNLTDPDTLHCASATQFLPGSTPKIPGHEDSATAELSEPCGKQSTVFSTGNGDWTQPDSVQGYLLTSSGPDARPSGSPLQIDGPVISLVPEPGQTAARAVVLDLKTGHYEAYVITANCGH
jgi:hypothetical protein